MEKNVFIKITNADTKALFEKEIERLQEEKRIAKDKSNARNAINRIQYLFKFLDVVPDSVTYTVEGVRGDGKIRAFNLPNVGSVLECIINYLLGDRDKTDLSKAFSDSEADFEDALFDRQYEIKASISSKFLATPSEKRCTILVNRRGVSVIWKREIAKNVDSRGRLKSDVIGHTPSRIRAINALIFGDDNGADDEE